MKVYIVQNNEGDVWLFTEKPKKLETVFHDYRWTLKSNQGFSICLTDCMNCKKHVKKDGYVEYLYLADFIGLKREYKSDGRLYYRGINTREPRQVEIDTKKLSKFIIWK